MFTRSQYQELMNREHKEQKLNVHWVLPERVRVFNKRFWEEYTELRPGKWEKGNLVFNEPRFCDSSAQEYHNQEKIIDHWVTSDLRAYVLVKGNFGLKQEREVWFTVEEYLNRNTGKLVFYVMKNGLIFLDSFWWFISFFGSSVQTNKWLKENMEEPVPDEVRS